MSAVPVRAWSALTGLAVTPFADGGLINDTYTAGDPPVYAVQRVNARVFAPTVHQDIDAVTRHVAARGLVTPRLVPTDTGELCHITPEGEIWRVMTWVPGVTVQRVDGPARAREAGALVARFHAAVDDLDWSYRHVRPGAHNTVAHMDSLERAMRPGLGLEVADGILEAWRTWAGRMDLPERHAHGDLKLSNLRFDADGRGVCLIDLDTLARLSLDVELGDAWRSWCNPVGEDSAEPWFDLDVFEASASGYLSVRAITDEEAEALVSGIERICLELASRFCRDVWENRYFGWNPKFGSRAAHNLHRARGQLALAVSLRSRAAEAQRRLASARAGAPPVG